MSDENLHDGLLLAISSGNVELAGHYVRKGVQVNQCHNTSKTYLHVAAQFQQPACCQFLLDHQANVRARDKKRRTALQVAAYHGSPACCRLLISAGVDVTDNRGRAALHSAAYQGNNQCCKLLLRYKANVNLSDHMGWTPLHTAALQDQTECCLALLHHGADPLSRTHSGQSCLDIANDQGHQETLQALKEYVTTTMKTKVVSSRWNVKRRRLSVWSKTRSVVPQYHDGLPEPNSFFLAHPGEYKHAAIVVAKLLRARGKRVFLDTLCIRNDKEKAIYSAIASHECFVAFTDPLFCSKPWCQREFGAVKSHQALRHPQRRPRILCLRLGNDVEYTEYSGTSATCGDMASRIIEFFDRFIVSAPLNRTERESIPIWLEQFEDHSSIPFIDIKSFVGEPV